METNQYRKDTVNHRMHIAAVQPQIYPDSALYIVTFILFYFIELVLHVIFVIIFTNPTP